MALKNDLYKTLKYWMGLWDGVNGGFVKTDPQGKVEWDCNRTGVTLCRALYGLSVGYQILKSQDVLESAEAAFRYIADKMIDREYGGIWIAVDYLGKPCAEEKATYEQDFLILALTEYYAASGDPAALDIAKEVYERQQSARGAEEGYADYYSRDWTHEIEPVFGRKRSPTGAYSIDAQTHTLEAYTNLLRVWKNDSVCNSCAELVGILCGKAYLAGKGSVGSVFSKDWTSCSPRESFGDDAEAGWFSLEAMTLIGDSELTKRCRANAVNMIHRSLEGGFSPIYGTMLDSCDGETVDHDIVWWTMCEMANACLVAARTTGIAAYETVADTLWQFISTHFIKKNGAWYAKLKPDGTPYEPGMAKAPLPCLYHNVRAMAMRYSYLLSAEKKIWR